MSRKVKVRTKKKLRTLPLRASRKEQAQARAMRHNGPHGLIFDLCCGQMAVASGFGNSRGVFRVDMESHGFSLTLLFSEAQAMTLGSGLIECVSEAKKSVN